MATEKELMRELAETLRKASDIVSQLVLADDIMPTVPEKTSSDIAEEQTEGKQITEKNLEKAVTELFIELGIPANVKGYRYLREAIIMAVKKPNILNFITKELYPEVAIVYNTTSSRVERAIRNAIEIACGRGNWQKLNEIFGYTLDCEKGKPTNSHFVAMLSDKLRMEMMV